VGKLLKSPLVTSPELPHHLYRKRPRGEVSKRPLITSSELPHHLYRKRSRGEARVNFPTTYTRDGLVGKLVNVRNLHPYLPHHLYRRGARGEARVNFPTTYTRDGLVGKFFPDSPTTYGEEQLVGKLASVYAFSPPTCTLPTSPCSSVCLPRILFGSRVAVFAFAQVRARPSGAPVCSPPPPPSCARVIGACDRGPGGRPSLKQA